MIFLQSFELVLNLAKAKSSHTNPTFPCQSALLQHPSTRSSQSCFTIPFLAPLLNFRYIHRPSLSLTSHSNFTIPFHLCTSAQVHHSHHHPHFHIHQPSLSSTFVFLKPIASCCNLEVNLWRIGEKQQKLKVCWAA